ncbi:MAG: isochorismatase family protein [Acidobacteria bacterium]|nr:isochorismatase family protein [Acidobacteriota bacterium]
MTIFWDVDTQVDFMLPGGKLYVPGAERIIGPLGQLTRWAGAHQIPVIASACRHIPGDSELEIYGQHCMAGTAGQQKIPETLLARRVAIPNRTIELPDFGPFEQIVIEKQAFDVFTNPNTEEVVKKFGSNPRIILYGVATDICVAAAARALVARACRVELVTDAVAALDEREAAKFVEWFQKNTGELTTVSGVVGRGTA